MLEVGGDHSMVLKSDGTLWKTGDNHYGQLGCEGDGSTVWMPDRFFEALLLESLVRQPDEYPDTITESPDDWRGFSL